MRIQDTTLSARDQIKSKRLTLRDKVLNYITQAGDRGATDEELQQVLFMAGNTERPRRDELLSMGLIRDSGRRRKTSSNRDAIVWVVRSQVGRDTQGSLFR